ncbi:MAG TPA: DUF5995 family protein [Polyangiaceae bacterium]|nr:DUF5995 family protein [Polyangiaceae bacterium]
MRRFAIGVAIAWGCVAQPSFADTGVSERLVCEAGHPRCVDLVLRNMERRLRALSRTCDHDAIFSLLYFRTTEKFEETLPALGYGDTRAVVREDALFADYYFRAYDAYHRGWGYVPPAWQITFEAAEQRAVSAIGNALLSMNAHIQRDLPFVLFELDRRGRPVSYADHLLVNEFLAQVDVAREIAARFDPAFATNIDPAVLQQLIVSWRELAFANYLRLRSAATLEAWLAVAADIERSTAELARTFVQQTAYPAGTDSSARDAFCGAAARP